MITIRKPGRTKRGNPAPAGRGVGPRRHARFVLALGVLLAMAGCPGFGNSVSTMTWNGREITVVEFNSISMLSTGDRAEIDVPGHKIVLTDDAITVDGTERKVSGYTEVKIRPLEGGVEVLVDGSRRLFP